MRVLEFMKDYDKLRSGRIPATSFRRALDLCGFCLGQDEVTALEREYAKSFKLTINCTHANLAKEPSGPVGVYTELNFPQTNGYLCVH